MKNKDVRQMMQDAARGDYEQMEKIQTYFQSFDMPLPDYAQESITRGKRIIAKREKSLADTVLENVAEGILTFQKDSYNGSRPITHLMVPSEAIPQMIEDI